MEKREAASMLVGLIFSGGLGGNAESDPVVLREAVRQFQNAFPRSAGRAWLRECLAIRNRRNCRAAIILRPSGRSVVQCPVPQTFMIGLHVVDQGIPCVFGAVER